MMFVEENGSLLITLHSGSEAAAQNLTVTITLPVSFTYVSSDPVGTVVGNVISYSYEEFALGGLVYFGVVVKPTVEGTFTSSAAVSADNPSAPGSVVYDEVEHIVFDRRACAVTLTNGGGDSFDCYTVGVFVPVSAGTGLSGVWISGDNLTGFVYGDSFDSYTVEATPLTQSLAADESYTTGTGTAFSGAWILEVERLFGDDFNSYTVEDPLTQTLNSGTGFSAAWITG